MPESNREGKPKETRIFPVSSEAVNRGLGEISSDPLGTLEEEAILVKTDDKDLDNLISAMRAAYEDNISSLVPYSFLEGAFWTRRILRTQSDIVGKPMPKITTDIARTHHTNQIHKGKPGQSMEEVSEEFMRDLRTTEPELARGIDEMAKYKSARHAFIEGVKTVYETYEAMEEGEVLEGKLGY